MFNKYAELIIVLIARWKNNETKIFQAICSWNAGKKEWKRAESKDKELQLSQRELEFNRMKFEVEAQERKERLRIELEERKTMLELLKKHL